MPKQKVFKHACRTFALLLCVATGLAAQAQVVTKLVSFNGINGANPAYEALVQGFDGNFYGTTSAGGANNGGTIFRITPTGKLMSLYNFCALPNCADGGSPIAGLVLATDENFYGTTSAGGVNGNYGTIFKITSKGALTTLYSFCAQANCADGSDPTAPLVQGSDGNFYGITNTGGANNYGTVFKITASGRLTTLYSFCAQLCTDGANPFGGLVQATDGNFYGTTEWGGIGGGGSGTVFRITPSGRLKVLHYFEWDGGYEGGDPRSTLIQANDGNFYGTTELGGAMGCADGCGTIFKMTPLGEVTTLVGFDGETPEASLMQGTDGNLYGGVVDEAGSIFKVTLAGGFTRLHDFNGHDGGEPLGQLMQATNGTFYGTTTSLGNSECNSYNGCGTVYSLSMGLGPFVSFVRNPAKVGQQFGILGQGFNGATAVSLNGAPVNFTVKLDTLVIATVPPEAVTGDVTVATPTGVLTSNVPFRVLPQLLSFDPPSGPVGTVITITGVSLNQTTGVGFGNYVPAQFTVISDTQVTATVPAGAKTGHVGIQTQGGRDISSAVFTVTQ